MSRGMYSVVSVVMVVIVLSAFLPGAQADAAELLGSDVAEDYLVSLAKTTGAATDIGRFIENLKRLLLCDFPPHAVLDAVSAKFIKMETNLRRVWTFPVFRIQPIPSSAWAM